ncbi:unnamed protein product [Lymnaea stagnalis]|uniref:Kazal-like domain-containing protein n=1 Tax=Lymnaea stagnalis TaxID=6523 RepID=A0AAV2HFJ9_LYMST
MNALNFFSLFSIVLLLGCVNANTIPGRGIDCDKPCPRIYSPVCASNGVTYNSRCEFEVADCKKLTEDLVIIVKEGACIGGLGAATPRRFTICRQDQCNNNN